MKKIMFLGLMSLMISYVSAQSTTPQKESSVNVVNTTPASVDYPIEPAVNNGVNNTINVYPPAPSGSKKNNGRAWYSTWYGREYYQYEYLRQISDFYQKNADSHYWKGRYEGFLDGLSFEQKSPPDPPADRSGERIFWGFVALAALGIILYFLNRNTATPPVAPATTPFFIYPPAPAPSTPHHTVPPTASELMKLIKENGGIFKAGSDGSWTADIWEPKKENPEVKDAPVEVKDQK
jgi:hypothetical protein